MDLADELIDSIANDRVATIPSIVMQTIHGWSNEDWGTKAVRAIVSPSSQLDRPVV